MAKIVVWTQRKISKFLFEFRKTTRSSKHNKKFIVVEKEITDQTQPLECIREFYGTSFKDKAKLYKGDLTKNDLYNSLISMQNDKSPSNDGLTK